MSTATESDTGTVAPRQWAGAGAAVRDVVHRVVRRSPPSPDGTPTRTNATAKRVRVPTVLQMEAVECGAASLAMILAAFGKRVPLEELRVACGVSRDGSKASNILKAARTYGMVCKGFKKEPADLRTMPGPMILHWNFNHFVVFEGFERDRAYVNDPASGPASFTIEEFDQSFTGVALTFEAGPDFERGGKAQGIVSAVARRLPGSQLAIAFVVLAGLALVLPGMVAPAFQRVFVDQVLVSGLRDWVTPLLWMMGITAVVNALLVLVQQHYLLRLETKLAVETSGRFLWHVLSLPVVFFTQRFAGDIGNRVTINDRVARMLGGDLATTALNIVVIVFYAMLLLQYDVLLTLIGVTTAAVNIIALKVVERRRDDISRRLVQDRGKMMGTAMNGLQIIETLKSTGSESDFFARWAGQQAKVSNAYQQLQLTSAFLGVVPPLLLALNGALVLGMGGVRVMDGVMSVGTLMAFQALMSSFLSPVNRMVELAGSVQEVKGDLARLDDVLDAKRDPNVLADFTPSIDDSEAHAATSADSNAAVATASARPEPTKLTGQVVLRDISFGYSRLDPPLIEHLSLELQPGSRVALVGGSGCGKSTIARLIAGLHQPWSGEILFDGQQRTDLPRATMTASLAVVDQEISTFEDTIAANITLWDDTIAEHDLVRAAQDACIHDDIVSRPGGYAAIMEESGRNFSGGQRQRLEIARALVGNPSILVLDEATSALDPLTEQRIDANLRRRGCTCVIVAHRLSTIRDCDEIIVLDRGRIMQRGTHEELLAVRGHYRDLISAE